MSKFLLKKKFTKEIFYFIKNSNVSKYEIGSIVFVSKYKYDNGSTGKNHLFVIIDDDNNLVPIEYFGMIVSSHIEKSKLNSNFKFNEPLNKNNLNNLKVDSIVKCDLIYKIPAENIQFKIGYVDIDDYIRFINTYCLAIGEIENDFQYV